MKKFRLAIFASGNGSNAIAIVNHFATHPNIEIALILSNNPEAAILERASELGVESTFFTREDFKENGLVDGLLKQKEITHIVLAGFLWLVPIHLIKQYPDKIVNIHPALLPKYGGKGMYGMRVHETVKNSGDKESGITIHKVNEHFDKGAPLLQVTCSVEEHDTVAAIAAKVQVLEHTYYPTTIEKWVLS